VEKVLINAERISAFEKSELPEVSKALSAEDVRQLAVIQIGTVLY
jgi:hypothetical protein